MERFLRIRLSCYRHTSLSPWLNGGDDGLEVRAGGLQASLMVLLIVQGVIHVVFEWTKSATFGRN